MTLDSPPPAARPRALFAGAGFVAGFIAAALLAAVAGWALYARGGLRFDMSRATVVHQVQQLQRLETVVYSMEKIVTGSMESRYLPSFLAGDRLLLIVYGDVTAGIDLAALDVEAVEVNGSAITLSLPSPDIFSTRIDNDKTRVYSRETGLFTSPDPNLESEVRREAERQVRQAALDGGILKAAAANARTTLATFIRGLGFEAVQFR